MNPFERAFAPFEHALETCGGWILLAFFCCVIGLLAVFTAHGNDIEGR